MNQGWIKLHRGWREALGFNDEPFGRAEAWIDLIELANWKPGKWFMSDHVIVIPRGAFITSEEKLAARWKWSRKKVHSFLKLLQSDSMLAQEKHGKATLLKIVNYEKYQSIPAVQEEEEDTKGTEEAQVEHRNGTGEEQEKSSNGTQYKKEKELKEGEEGEPPRPGMVKLGKWVQISEIERDSCLMEFARNGLNPAKKWLKRAATHLDYERETKPEKRGFSAAMEIVKWPLQECLKELNLQSTRELNEARLEKHFTQNTAPPSAAKQREWDHLESVIDNGGLIK